MPRWQSLAMRRIDPPVPFGAPGFKPSNSTLAGEIPSRGDIFTYLNRKKEETPRTRKVHNTTPYCTLAGVWCFNYIKFTFKKKKIH